MTISINCGLYVRGSSGDSSSGIVVKQHSNHDCQFMVCPLLATNIDTATAEQLNFSVPSADDISRTLPVVSLSGVVDVQVFRRQLDWAVHCGYHAVLLKAADAATLPPSQQPFHEAHLISTALQSNQFNRFTAVWLEVEASKSGWQRWNAIRQLLFGGLTNNHSERSLPALALRLPTSSLQAKLVDDDGRRDLLMIDQWRAEPVAAVIVPAESMRFQSAASAAGVTTCWPIPRALQSTLHSIITRPPVADRSVVVILETFDGNAAMDQYEKFRNHLQTVLLLRPSNNHHNSLTIAEFAKGYEDVLQSPLQPLQDNLDACTYQVFMQDPVKYALYQEAIYHALHDRLFSASSQVRVNILVVGAGSRGPLVECCLRAVEELACWRRIGMLLAVEKNPNALISLRQHASVSAQWQLLGDRLQIIGGDIRTVDLPAKADFIVSELLGSFGDNELSPECLDAAQRWLNPGGHFIPRSSHSFATPISSSRLHSRVGQFLVCNSSSGGGGKLLPAPYETPYVVYFSQVNDRICKPQPVWEFQHPSESDSDNQRFANVRFTIGSYPTLLHGFAGYFESILWESDSCRVIQSINPETHSPDMTSWFPLYFPLETAVPVDPGDSVEFQLRRCSDRRKVWYEWSCSVNGQPKSFIHNQNGRGYSIGLI